MNSHFKSLKMKDNSHFKSLQIKEILKLNLVNHNYHLTNLNNLKWKKKSLLYPKKD